MFRHFSCLAAAQLHHHRLKLFRRCLGPYEYYVDEDVKFAVRSFSDLIVSKQCEVLYYLYIGEGVGGAAVHGGNMLRGLNAAAGDAGHLLSSEGVTYSYKVYAGYGSSISSYNSSLSIKDKY